MQIGERETLTVSTVPGRYVVVRVDVECNADFCPGYAPPYDPGLVESGAGLPD